MESIGIPIFHLSLTLVSMCAKAFVISIAAKGEQVSNYNSIAKVLPRLGLDPG